MLGHAPPWPLLPDEAKVIASCTTPLCGAVQADEATQDLTATRRLAAGKALAAGGDTVMIKPKSLGGSGLMQGGMTGRTATGNTYHSTSSGAQQWPLTGQPAGHLCTSCSASGALSFPATWSSANRMPGTAGTSMLQPLLGSCGQPAVQRTRRGILQLRMPQRMLKP